MIKLCADSSLFLGKVNQSLLTLQREKIMSELNQNYPQFSFSEKDHPKLIFRDDLTKAIKKNYWRNIAEAQKVEQSLTQGSPFTIYSNSWTISKHFCGDTFSKDGRSSRTASVHTTSNECSTHRGMHRRKKTWKSIANKDKWDKESY